MMFQHDLKIAFRNLSRQFIYSFINILGFSPGIACCILIFAFVHHEWSYDTFHENADNIYRVIFNLRAPNGDNKLTSLTPLPLAPALQDEYPEIHYVTRLAGRDGVVAYKDKTFSEKITFADPSFFEMFSFPLQSGNAGFVLNDPNSVVLTPEMAAKYFGKTNPVGQRLSMTFGGRTQELTVAGVVKNAPENSTIQYDFILPFVQKPEYDRQAANWGASDAYTYMQLAENISPAVFAQKTLPFIQKYLGDRIRDSQESQSLSAGEDAWLLKLQPLTDIHLNPRVRWQGC